MHTQEESLGQNVVSRILCGDAPKARCGLKSTTWIILFVFLGGLRLSPSSSAQKSVAIASKVGVLVEHVEQGGEAEGAGLQVGDLIVGWSREGSDGTIESPFDWTEMLTEEAQRGTVTLRGWRSGKEDAWSLGLRAWGLTVTPVLPARLTEKFRTCHELQNLKKHPDAGVCWDALRRETQHTDPQWLRPYISLRLAESYSAQQSWTDAGHAYQQAVDQSRAVGQQSLAQVLEAWSRAQRDRGDLNAASDHCNEALNIRLTLRPVSLAVAKTLSDCGDIEGERENYEKAEQDYVKALAIRRELAPGSLVEAGSLGSLGSLEYRRGDFAKTESYHRQALKLREKLAPNSVFVADSLVLLGLVAWRRGDLAEAEKHIVEAHGIYERLSPGSYNVSATVTNMGLIALSRGDLAKAEDDFRQALAVQEKLSPGSLDVASKLSNLAIVAERRGDLAMAEDYEHRALVLRQNHGSGLGVASSLGVLGEVALGRQDYAKAEDNFKRALSLEQELIPESESVGGTLHTLGRVAQERGDVRGAEEYYLKALAIQEKLAPGGEMVAGTLSQLGTVAQANGNFAKAEEYLFKSLRIQEQLASGTQDHANVLHNLGLLMRAEGKMDKAKEYMAAALVALEHQSSELGGGNGIQAEFNAQQAFYYKDFIETLLDTGESSAAFLTAERSRARSLLTMLAERDIMIDADLPVEFLRARKKNEIAYDETQDALSKLTPVKDGARIEELQSRLRELGSERERLIDSVRRSSPRYASLKYPQPLGVDETRRMLDSGTILASFAVCPDRTILFVVQPTGVEPGLSVFSLPIGEKALRSQVQEFRKLILERRTAKDSLLTSQGRKIYDELLKPAESLLANADRLLIIPDGALHLLPFQALMRASDQYLVEWKPLNTVVSATVFAELKKARREESKPIELVAFGDPHYPPLASGHSEGIAEPQIRSAVERGLNVGRLPFSRVEVENVSALYPDRSRKYLGDQATEERAKTIGKDVRYIHFAVHGILDERLPLDSALVLSIPDKQTPGKDNGLLQAWEIFEQMHLDADLVTLSACNTGLGEELSGEGLVGLTRAFQYAGAHSIVASYWSVDDLRTMELMTELYKELRANKSKEKALQLAQSKLLHSKTASAPYYWAGFTLIGDWR